MASSLIAGAPTPVVCQGVGHGAVLNGGKRPSSPRLLPFRHQQRDVVIQPGAACVDNSQLQITTGSSRHDGATRSCGVVLDRREMVCKMMVASGAAALLSLGGAADAAHAAKGEIETAEEAATNPLIQKLLETSRANKAANDAARLEDYYKRNFKEYFEFVEGSVRNKKEMTPAEKAIVEWLAKNK